MSVADTTRFGIADYVVFAIMLAISAAIGKCPTNVMFLTKYCLINCMLLQ